MDGSSNPHDILKIKGEKELAKYLVDEVQEVYRLQGVKINDKHIEVIVRQMLRRVRVKDVGDTDFLVGEQVEKVIFERTNASDARGGQAARGGRAAAARHHQGVALHGVVHLGGLLPGDHQGAHRGLDVGQGRQPARGLKENVIMGRLIPAGTGMARYHDIGIQIEAPEELLARARRGDSAPAGARFGRAAPTRA